MSKTVAASGVPGHVVGLWAMDGLALFSDGDVASMTSVGTLDVVRGRGAYNGYAVYTFEDGSTKAARLEGRITELLADGGNLQQGTRYTHLAPVRCIRAGPTRLARKDLCYDFACWQRHRGGVANPRCRSRRFL